MKLNLVVDIGNSRTKWGLFEGKELMHSQQITNDNFSTKNDFFSQIDFHYMIISSVNRKVEQCLSFDSKNVAVLHLDHKTPLPIVNDYQSPETLGKDRIAAVVGAQLQFPDTPLLVIDAGTCVTYDFLTSDKRYIGGAISPGIQMRLRAMNEHTNKLPLLFWEDVQKPEITGNTSIASMLSGVVNGLIFEMDGFISSYEKQFSGLKIVLTGGDANFFEKALKNSIFADPNLVLKGLNEILIYNH